jgi:hypothetical protein
MHRYSKLPDVSRVGRSVGGRNAPVAARPRPRVHNIRKRLSPDDIARLVADYEAGSSTAALMKHYGLGKGTVLRILNEAGVTRKQNTGTVEQINQAVELYTQGWSLVRIGEHLGFCQSTVWLWLQERNVGMRRAWERSNAGR